MDNNKNRQICRVFSRVNGWYTGVESWNPGKTSEWRDRREYVLRGIAEMKNA